MCMGVDGYTRITKCIYLCTSVYVGQSAQNRIGDQGNSLFTGNPTKLENGFVLTTCGWQSRCKLRYAALHT